MTVQVTSIEWQLLREPDGVCRRMRPQLSANDSSIFTLDPFVTSPKVARGKCLQLTTSYGYGMTRGIIEIA